MKNWQFYLLLGLLMMMNSNVEDNHTMKVWWGVLGPMVFGSGIGILIRDDLKKW
jgi:hypothetical protein